MKRLLWLLVTIAGLLPAHAAAQSYALAVSVNSNRSSAVNLNGQTVTASIYVFTSPAGAPTNANPTGITNVCFWLDNVAMSGTATHCEATVPFDYAGTGSTTATALPWNTAGAVNGTHTITQFVTKSAGGTETDTATFTVSNAPPPPGVTFFSPASFINTPLPGSPTLDPNSAVNVAAAFVNSASTSPNNCTNAAWRCNQAHLSNGSFGSALVYSSPSDQVYTITCTGVSYSICTSGPTGQVQTTTLQFPIPATAIFPSGSDKNTAFVYTTIDGGPYSGMELDCWVPHNFVPSTHTLSCNTAAITQNIGGWGTCAGSNVLGVYCNGGYAAGVSLAAGPVRPEEIQAGAINHALVVAVSNIGSISPNNIACPATHTDHSGTGIPEGGHFFLPSSFNVAAQSWPAWVKLVALALQNYGGYIIDYGGNMEIKGFTDQNPGSITWASVGVPVDNGTDLNMIPWNQMQLVKMTANTGSGTCDFNGASGTTYTLTTATSGSGTGTVTGAASYASGASYSSTATPTGSSIFSSWSSSCGGTASGSTYSGLMPASNCTVTAVFTRISTPQITAVGWE